MSEGAFVTGWRVYRSRRLEFLDPARLRRRTVVCGTVAAVSGAVVVVSDLLAPWTGGPLAVTVVFAVAIAAALGCFVAAFWRVSAKQQAQRWTPMAGGWRRSERIGRQFAARPPAMAPEDRDEVLAQARRSVEPMVVAVERLRWIPVAWTVAWVGVLVSGFASTDQLIVLLFPPVFAVLQSASPIAAVTALGRAESARRRAEALPPYSPPPAPAARNTEPRGSKLGLPGDD